MSNPFVAEIRIVGFDFAPVGWAFCDGQILPVDQNTALFSLLGTTYGSDGDGTFALPDLRGRAPLQAGQGPGLTDRVLGEAGGQSTVTLTEAQMPAHTHTPLADADPAGRLADPAGAGWAKTGSRREEPPVYTSTPADGATMSSQALAAAGSSRPHNNMPPYLALSFVIALVGAMPSPEGS